MAHSAASAVTNGSKGSVGVVPSPEALYAARTFCTQLIVPYCLKAVIDLGVLDVLEKAEGKPLSAGEILAHLPTKSNPGPESAHNLVRLMRPLVREGFFSESFNKKQRRVYGLTELSKWFLKDQQSTFQAVTAFLFDKGNIPMWNHLQDIILDDNAIPFEAEHGIPMYKYTSQNPEYGAVFYKAMIGLSDIVVDEVVHALQESGVLDGVQTLVDVGGGQQGSIVSEIVARNPQIQGINFDIPPVIANAPEVKGVQHVAGDFMEGVPSADTLFLKYILHNHGDEQCIHILKNCFKALSRNGSVIIAEHLLFEQDSSNKAGFAERIDIVMLASLKGARERTEAEYQSLLQAAGFSTFNLFLDSNAIDLVQGIKG